MKNKPGTSCFRLGSIIHEILHALGFYHVQSSTNRDDHVNIVWDNINKCMCKFLILLYVLF